MFSGCGELGRQCRNLEKKEYVLLDSVLDTHDFLKIQTNNVVVPGY